MEQNPQKQYQKPITLEFSLEGRQTTSITLLEQSENDSLLDYDEICKKVMQNYKYITSGKKNIRLVICNYWGNIRKVKIPIFNPKNWSTLVHDMLQRDIHSIEIQVVKLGELKVRKQRMKQNAVEFDSDGSIQSAEDCNIKEAIVKNTPEMESYKGDAVVRCHFCNLTSRDKKCSRQAGPFYGPFQGKNYAHLLCLLWMSYVYLDQNSKLCGVKEAINITKYWKCSLCKQKGGSFYCHQKSCKKMAHYRCAMRAQWYFKWNDFTVFCPKDRQVIQEAQSYSTLTLTNQRRKKNKEQVKEEREVKEEQLMKEQKLEQEDEDSAIFHFGKMQIQENEK